MDSLKFHRTYDNNLAISKVIILMIVSKYNLGKLISQTLASKCYSIASPHIVNYHQSINLCSPISRAYQLPIHYKCIGTIHTHSRSQIPNTRTNNHSSIAYRALAGIH